MQEGTLGEVVAKTSELVGIRLHEVMQPTRETLREKNKDLRGRLFVSVGSDQTEAFIFDSPVQIVLSGGEDDGKKVNEFLAVAEDGPMLIQIRNLDDDDKDVHLTSATSLIEGQIRWLRKRPESSDKVGYVDDEDNVGVKVLILQKENNRSSNYYFRGEDSVVYGDRMKYVRLVKNPDQKRVVEIYLRNLQRAQQETGINVKGLLAAKALSDTIKEK